MMPNARKLIAALLVWALPLSALSGAASPCWHAGDAGETVSAGAAPEHGDHRDHPPAGAASLPGAQGHGAVGDGGHAADSSHCPCCDGAGCAMTCPASTCTALAIAAPGLPVQGIALATRFGPARERIARDLSFRPPLRPPIIAG